MRIPCLMWSTIGAALMFLAGLLFGGHMALAMIVGLVASVILGIVAAEADFYRETR